MHTPMRRKNLERKDPTFVNDVLQRANEIYIAFQSPDAPYVVPLNFVYFEGKIYFHSALQGRKLDCLQYNPKVGFSAAVDIAIIPEKASTIFNSVIGTGHASIVEDVAEKGRALDALAKRYNAACEMPATDKMIEHTAIVRIDIESICGKGKNAPIELDD